MYELLSRRNGLVDRGNRLLAENERIKLALLSELDALVAAQLQTAEHARATAARTVLALRIILLAVVAAMVVWAFLGVARGSAAR